LHDNRSNEKRRGILKRPASETGINQMTERIGAHSKCDDRTRDREYTRENHIINCSVVAAPSFLQKDKPSMLVCVFV